MSFTTEPTPPAGAEFPADWFPTAVVFDCDGVLMDTEAAWGRVVAGVGHELGLEDPTAVAETLTALTAAQVAQGLAEMKEGPDAAPETVQCTAARVLSRLQELDAQRLVDGVELMPGVEPLVRRLAEVLPVAVASNSSGNILQAKMEHSGLTPHLRTWVSCEDVSSAKPAPDMYLEAVRRLDGDPGRTLAFEDSAPGARAAVAAGTRTVVVGGHASAHGHHRVSTFEDPQFLAQVQQWLDACRAARDRAGAEEAH